MNSTMKANRFREFDPCVGDTFHALVKSGGHLTMHNGHKAGPRPNIHHTVMPLRGTWKVPEELRERFKEARWVELE